MVDTYRSGEIESGREPGSVRTSYKQEKCFLHQERSSAVQAAHPSYFGLRVPPVEVCRSLPIRKLQVFQSRSFCITTDAPWYIGNRHVHDDLRAPFSTDYIRSVPERSDANLALLG
jgi:hypothetical protein